MTGAAADGGPIRSIAIAGGGVAAWSAAVAFARRLPHLAVTVIDTGAAGEGPSDRVGALLPSAQAFHDSVGIPEAALVRQIGASYRLGSLIAGFGGTASRFVHSYDGPDARGGELPFRYLWVRAMHDRGAPPFDSFAAAAAMARAGRFDPHEAAAEGTPYGLTVDPTAYRSWLKGYAAHLGVRIVATAIAGVTRSDATGHIAAVACEGADPVVADLFIDAAGPSRPLHASQSGAFEGWSRWLPADRLIVATGPAGGPPPLIEQVARHPAGWHWSGASLAGAQHGLVYAGTLLSDEAAARQMAGATGLAAGSVLRFAQGRVAAPWAGNCVAIGDAAVVIEPLQFGGLHLVHAAIDRIIAKLPDRGFADVELADYNREANLEADRMRDFVLAHYQGARPGVEPDELPASLAHTLRLFGERGRLPFYELESFSQDSWAAVLIGTGLIPRRLFAPVRAIAMNEVDSAMRAMHEAIARRVAGVPPVGTTLRQLLERHAA